MAMLGVQADTQCGYFSGAYSTRDLNSHGSYNTWPLCNVDGVVINGRSIGSSAPPYSNQHLAYKEMLRQTMIQQEVTFRHQLGELHRLHKRQRELMDEMKRSGLNRHHLQLETLQMHPFLLQNSFESPSKIFQVSSTQWLNPSCSKFSGLLAENNGSYLTYDQGKFSYGGCENGGCIKEADWSETKCKRVCKKILDLELPADEYIDSDEENLFLGESVSKVPVPKLHGSDKVAHSTSGLAKCLVDLNEPLNLEQETDSDASNLLATVPEKAYSPQTHPGVACDTPTRGDPLAASEILCHQRQHGQPLNTDEIGQGMCDWNSFTEGTYMKSVLRLSEDDRSKHAHEMLTSDILDESGGKLQSKRMKIPYEENDMGHESSLVTSISRHKHDVVNPLPVVQALPCFRASVEMNKRPPRFKNPEVLLDKSCQDKVLKCYLKSDCAGVQSGICETNDEFATKNLGAKEPRKVTGNLKSKKLRDSVSHSHNKAGKKELKDASGFSTWRKTKLGQLTTKKRRKLTHVESKGSEATEESDGDEFSLSSSPEIKLETSMQCPLSGAESSEVQVCRQSQPTCQNGNEMDMLVRNAAEAIVSISSFDIETSNGKCVIGPDSLERFARITSYAVDDPESMFGISLSCGGLDLVSGSSSHEFDYFEAMTLSLKEADIEEYLYKPSNQLESSINSVEKPSELRCSRLRRGRQQRKDFQSEVLSTLAILSWHEVSEDLYSIGGLVESAHNRRGGIAGKSGDMVRTKGRRGRKPGCVSNTMSALFTSSNQQTKKIELEIEDRKLTCWGKINRRRRGRRYPARNPLFIIGKV